MLEACFSTAKEAAGMTADARENHVTLSPRDLTNEIERNYLTDGSINKTPLVFNDSWKIAYIGLLSTLLLTGEGRRNEVRVVLLLICVGGLYSGGRDPLSLLNNMAVILRNRK